jgi:hypothetical protein
MTRWCVRRPLCDRVTCKKLPHKHHGCILLPGVNVFYLENLLLAMISTAFGL